MRWIISGIGAIILGLAGKFALVGTNSPLALVGVGILLILTGIVRIILKKMQAKEKIEMDLLNAWKKGSGMRPFDKNTKSLIIALVVCGFFILPHLIGIINRLRTINDLTKSNLSGFIGSIIIVFIVGFMLILLFYFFRKAKK